MLLKIVIYKLYGNNNYKNIFYYIYLKRLKKNIIVGSYLI